MLCLNHSTIRPTHACLGVCTPGGILELSRIVDAFAAAVPWIDDTGTNPPYYPGLPTMTEPQVCTAFKKWWDDPSNRAISEGMHFLLEQKYPKPHGRNKCDLVISTSKTRIMDAEWWIEFKRIQFVGDNGKNNDYGTPKLFSPYAKDSSFTHDILRLARDGRGQRKAVVLYAFDYNKQSCDEAKKRFPDLLDQDINGKLAKDGKTPDPVHHNLRATCASNKKDNLDLSIGDVLPLLDALNESVLMGCLSGHENRTVDGLWRHPCGGRLQIHAWEVSV